MNTEIIKFVHLLICVSFLGMQIAGYYYLITAVRQPSKALIQYTLANNLILDLASTIIILGIFISCQFLMTHHQPALSFDISWIKAACVLLAFVTVLFIVNITVKLINLSYIRKTIYQKFKYFKTLNFSYCAIIICLIIIIHDAVMKSTILDIIL